MNIRQSRKILLFFVSTMMMAITAFIVVFGFIGIHAEREFDPESYGDSVFGYRVVPYSNLSGWPIDDQSRALKAFVRSCEAIMAKDDFATVNGLERLGDHAGAISLAGTVADWRPSCLAATEMHNRDQPPTNVVARQFFERYFKPVQILSVQHLRPEIKARVRKPLVDETGLFTGYFEPIYKGSDRKTTEFSAPLYPRPSDLVEVNLGAFSDDYAGKRIVGRVRDRRLVPYPDHAEINQGALDGALSPIAWLDPNDLLFLQIQGSGQLMLDTGEALRVGYAAQNGHPYTAIGKVMVERNIMQLPEVSMNSIMTWLRQAPPRSAQKMREENASYVFFRKLDIPVAEDFGPLGAQGISLIKERSLAVDRRYHAMGAPVWIDIEPLSETSVRRYQRLMIAQDTGGAIRGPIRGDVYWGSGEDAGDIAGSMRADGKMYVLLPNAVANRLPQSPSS